MCLRYIDFALIYIFSVRFLELIEQRDLLCVSVSVVYLVFLSDFRTDPTAWYLLCFCQILELIRQRDIYCVSVRYLELIRQRDICCVSVRFLELIRQRDIFYVSVRF